MVLLYLKGVSVPRLEEKSLKWVAVSVDGKLIVVFQDRAYLWANSAFHPSGVGK